MDQELKTKWVAALRSGDYKQGNGYLHKIEWDGSESFCCVGVLCKIASETHPELISVSRTQFAVSYAGRCNMVDEETCESLMLPNRDTLAALAIKNDGWFIYNGRGNGWAFNRIADYIEENL